MSMFAAMCPKCGTMHDQFTAVDGSIVCHVDRDAKVRAEVRERIAQKIEDEHGEDCYDPFLVCTHNEDAAIARGKPS